MNDTYAVGSLVRLTAVFRNEAGAAADPDTVACKVRNPAGTISTYTPTKTAIGNYAYDVTVSTSGEWKYRFEGTGAVTAADEQAFFVRDSAFD